MIVASEIARRYTKTQIMEFYLNTVNYGNLAYGVQAAAQTYFGKDAKDLNLAQAAFIAGLVQSPATYDPVQNRSAAMNRYDDVLLTYLYERGFTAGEFGSACAIGVVILALILGFAALVNRLFRREAVEL